MFVDKVLITFTAGKGGNGVVAWRRERYIRKGGPAGGNGGAGGLITLEADVQVHSLEPFRNRRFIKAENGRQGGTRQCTGRKGKSLLLKVPCGTLVKDAATGEILFDFTEDKQQWKICCGGKGGRGNASFKTPTNRAPNICTEGKAGEIRDVELELKLIADVGLVGFPNAGKSTLISSVANSRVKIAPYPFTTLRPNLGKMRFDDFSSILMADIPGIIKGAHENRGLGLEFLRHIERTKVLVYVLDASGIDGRHPIDDFYVLRDEIASYDQNLLRKPFLVLLNKVDTEEGQTFSREFREQYPFDHGNLLDISALEKTGLAGFSSTLQGIIPQAV